MILNPISIATQGVYANDRNLALASKGYIDLAGAPTVIHPSGVDLFEERRQEEEDIVLLMNTFLFMVNKNDRH